MRQGVSNLAAPAGRDRVSGLRPFHQSSPRKTQRQRNPRRCPFIIRPSADISQQIMKRRLELKKTRKQMAKEMGISVKTLWGWETKRHKSSALLQDRILQSFGFHPRQR